MKMGRNRSRGKSMKQGRSRRGGDPEDETPPNGNGMPPNGNGMPPNGNEISEEEEDSLFGISNLFATAKDTAVQGVNKIETNIGSATDTIGAKTEETGKGLMDSFTGFFKGAPANPIDTAAAPAAGGRRRSRSKSMKMKGGLNPAFGYNAAPVMDSNTAEPTYMIQGGKRRRRRTCKKKRKCCKKSCRKRHRHIHRR